MLISDWRLPICTTAPLATCADAAQSAIGNPKSAMQNWGRRRDLHSPGANARRFTKPLLPLLSHVGCENCRLPIANFRLIGGLWRSQSAIGNRQSPIGNEPGGPPRCRPVLCGLRDRCIAAMLATRRMVLETGLNYRRNPRPPGKLVRQPGVAPGRAGWKPAMLLFNITAANWNPVLESHQPLRCCRPPPVLLGQRDVYQAV